MDGIGGKKGWAWIFILEGLATVIVGIVSYFFVYDFPDEAKFLSDRLLPSFLGLCMYTMAG